jgi:hypothetical protein
MIWKSSSKRSLRQIKGGLKSAKNQIDSDKGTYAPIPNHRPIVRFECAGSFVDVGRMGQPVWFHCRNPRPRFWLLHRRLGRIARILFGKPVDCIPIVLQHVCRPRSSRLFAAGHGILPIGIQAVFYRLTDGFSGSLKMHKRLLPIFIWGIFLRYAFF